MALTIIETPGAANANSFVSAARMTAYCEGRLNATIWTGAVAQLPALVEATRDLSSGIDDWLGVRTSATQALSWPRTGCPDPNDPNGGDFATDEIPTAIEDATCELALQYLKGGSADLAMPHQDDGVKVKTIDVMTTEYFEGAKPTTGLARFPRVLDLIRPWRDVSAWLRVIRC